jgi:hypothetical protein
VGCEIKSDEQRQGRLGTISLSQLLSPSFTWLC